MFVVIVCVKCGGSSQVDEAALGQTVQCPLCNQPTPARTQQAVLPVAKPVPQEVLSLDDDSPPPAKAKPKRSPLRTAVYTTLSLLFTLAVMAGIYGAFRYGNGDIPASAWEPFTPPGGQCSILMPGDPSENALPKDGFAAHGGKRFAVNRWFERVKVDFGWMDLDADQWLNAPFEKIAQELLDRELKRLNGKATTGHSLDLNSKGKTFKARRFAIDTEQGKAVLQVYVDADPQQLKHYIKKDVETLPVLVLLPKGLSLEFEWVEVEQIIHTERRVVEPGQRLRLYFALIAGKKINDKTQWAERFFASFAAE